MSTGHGEARTAPDRSTRWTLIERLKSSGGDAEWAEFYSIYRHCIHAVALRYGLRPEEAEDAVQETVLAVTRAIERLDTDPERGRFKSWLLTIAKRKMVDQLRARPREHSRQTRPENDGRETSTIERLPDESLEGVADVWEREWRKQLFDSAVNAVRPRVDPAQFQCFDFYVLRGRTASEVAALFGVPVGRVYLAKFRILKQVDREIRRLLRDRKADERDLPTP